MTKKLISLYSQRLIDTFSPLIPRDRPVALVDFPDSANCGDHAIWLGEKKLLRDLNITPAYQCSTQTYSAQEMAANLGQGTILMHGGGNFGDRYWLYHEFRLRVMSEFPNNKVIVFPQQATFLDNEYLQRSAALVAKHPNVTLFARSLMAQHLMARYFGASARVELAPDMAFSLGPQNRTCEPIYDVVWLARTDEERANDSTEGAARLSSQAAEKFTIPRFPDGIEINLVAKHRPPTVLLTDWYALYCEGEQARLGLQRLDFDSRSELFLSRAIYILSLGHLVITDRLHGHLLCLLLGIPHLFLNNDSGKNWNFYETWTRDTALCRLARNPAEAWSLARNAIPRVKEFKTGAMENWTWQTPADPTKAKYG